MIETIDGYQIHLLARTVSSPGPWAPYVVINQFDRVTRDFKCVIEKRRVANGDVFPTEQQAIDEARRHAIALLPTK